MLKEKQVLWWALKESPVVVLKWNSQNGVLGKVGSKLRTQKIILSPFPTTVKLFYLGLLYKT